MFTITYKGISSLGFLKVLKVTRSVLAPSQNKFLEMDGVNGGLFISKKLGMKKIEVEFLISDQRQDVRDMADWLDADKPEALICSDESDKTDLAILDGDTDLEEMLKAGFGTLIFICPDPYSVGSPSTQSLITGNTSVVNVGTAESYPKITVVPTVNLTSYTVSNGTESVTVTTAIASGSTLIIDMFKGKVTLNGTLIMETVSLTSDFFALKKGTNTITSSRPATIEYNKRFK